MFMLLTFLLLTRAYALYLPFPISHFPIPSNSTEYTNSTRSALPPLTTAPSAPYPRGNDTIISPAETISTATNASTSAASSSSQPFQSTNTELVAMPGATQNPDTPSMQTIWPVPGNALTVIIPPASSQVPQIVTSTLTLTSTSTTTVHLTATTTVSPGSPVFTNTQPSRTQPSPHLTTSSSSTTTTIPSSTSTHPSASGQSQSSTTKHPYATVTFSPLKVDIDPFLSQ
ncbi:hypothetical protein M426DRAFT_16207 [Hypoxylon sp. CI-4A]|nr:hypothetical protein M426DRAFT_16207 [Hypoxylon sp. CI-4A]